MSSINPKKMKVVELKKELEQRNITVTKSMKKADLLGLLMSAIESETGQELDLSSSETANDSQESIEDESQDTSINATVELTEQVSAQQIEKESSMPEPEPEPMEVKESEEAPAVVETTEEKADDAAEQVPQEKVDDAVNEIQQEKAELENMSSPVVDAIAETNVAETKETEKEETTAEDQDMEDVKTKDATDELLIENGEQEKQEEMAAGESEQAADESEQTAAATEEPTTKEETAPPTEQSSTENTESSSSHTHSRKRRHDDRGSRHHRMETPPPEEEPEEDFDDSLVVLDTYRADLNFKVSRDRTGGQPFTMEGFAYLWAGATATYGVSNGKICFECKVTEEDAVKHLPTDEPHPRVVRVGWSLDSAGLQLGEEPLSFGYGGTGKFSVDRKFTDYGESFHEGDVIGCFIEFTEDGSVSLSYTKNGKYLGVACTESKPDSGLVMFPHVLCKNSSVELNFGQKDEQFMEFPEEVKDYVFISKVPMEERVRAAKGPASRSECEVLMMCGLPGAGKTYYSKQLIKEHPGKQYNVLGTNSIMDKMRVMGVSRKQNYANRWELLIHNATQCLNRLLQIASRKRRNFIIDQTNVYASAQRRKMRPFAGFQRKAIVIVPTEEEFKTRFDKRTEEEGEELPEMAMLEMKANFAVPEKGNLFDDVTFAELQEEEATKIIEKYREEGAKHAPPPEKRSRGPNEQRNRSKGSGSGGWRQQNQRFRQPPNRFGPPGHWNRFGGRGPMNFTRGGFGPPMHGRGGGYGSRQSDYGRMRDHSRGDRRNNQGRSGGYGQNRNKGWQDQNNKGGYNRQNQGSGGNKGDGPNYSQQRNSGAGKWGGQQGSAPHSAQSYSYGNTQSYNASNNMSGYPSMGYNFSQGAANNNQTQQGYQQSGYGQPDYSQQWMQYYQQQAQNQQYQNYYANYQQYYNQQQGYSQPK